MESSFQIPTTDPARSLNAKQQEAIELISSKFLQGQGILSAERLRSLNQAHVASRQGPLLAGETFYNGVKLY